MNIETKYVKMNIIDILKLSLTIYFTNINFIIFTTLTSLPYFFLIVQTPKIISTLPFHDNTHLIVYSIYDDMFFYDGPNFINDYLPLLLQLCFIYSLPLHCLEFCSQILATDLAAKIINSEENNEIMSLKHMFQNSIDVSIMKGTFITSLYTLVLSNILLLAFPWTVSNCYALAGTFWCYMIFGVICFVAIGKLLMMYLEWSAIWNMSIVVSVLEGVYGIGALRVSYYFNSGSQKRGLVLMLVFFVFGGFLRFMCIWFECYKGGSGIFVQIGILCMVNTLKWVCCVVYFNDCKERKMEKKIDDLEVGDKGQLESSNPSKA